MWYPCHVTWGRPITCLTFRKFSSVILSSNAVFFNGPSTRAGIYFALDVPLDVMRAHIRSCVGPAIEAWLLAHPNILSFCLPSTLFFMAFHICFGIPHPIVPHLSWCQCGYIIDDLLFKTRHDPTMNAKRWFHSPCHKVLRLSPSSFWFHFDFLCTCYIAHH
jgi:hypothetical protein